MPGEWSIYRLRPPHKRVEAHHPGSTGWARRMQVNLTEDASPKGLRLGSGLSELSPALGICLGHLSVI